ncbi:TetR/AcrR family transcriptional regulator [Limnobacter litoralis]|uniref:HTH tetR-type domain-containing protein n=1 Tax=Limnobacter litoralis TaxID=481366 RepID=A0ABQ5YUB5_9BURK|nr:TetR family transcriptional regulator [Limnobacter litoralis]GLR27051.1 hypothetical protein GCM10007875_21420 [Limnobacter litoralis]
MINSTIRTLPTEAHSDTREHILQVALIEFAKAGIDAVKMSQIRDLAGQSNRSAVYYHFKTRELLVQAVVDRVKQGLAVHMDKAQQQFQERGPVPTVEAWVGLVFQPFLNYFMLNPEGPVGIRFLSRLTWQAGQQGQSVLQNLFLPYLEPFEDNLMQCLPGRDRVDVRFRIYLAVNSVVHGLADYSILLADEQLSPIFERPDWIKHLNSLFLGYIKGGLAEPTET